MKIENLKELQRVISACRRLGVQSIKIDSIELHLGELPPKEVKAKIAAGKEASPGINSYAPGGVTENTKIEAPEELTEEQLMFYSSRPEAFEQGQQ